MKDIFMIAAVLDLRHQIADFYKKIYIFAQKLSINLFVDVNDIIQKLK